MAIARRNGAVGGCSKETMDNNVIVAIIGGASAIISAAVTAVVAGGKAPVRGRSARHLASGAFLGATLVIAVVAAAAAAFFFDAFGLKASRAFEPNRLLPGARYEPVASNATATVELGSVDPKMDHNIRRYRQGAEVQMEPTSRLIPTHTLVYFSEIASKGSFTICRFVSPPSVFHNHNEAKGVRIVLWAQDDDTVELGLKDRNNTEGKPLLKLHSGWAIYEVPFDQFRDLNNRKVNPVFLTEFQIAFTASCMERSSNTLKIGLIEPYYDD